MLNIGTQVNAETQEGVPFTFSCVVTKKNFIVSADDANVEYEVEKAISARDELKRLAEQFNATLEGKGLSDLQTSDAWNHAGGTMSGSSPASAFSLPA